MFHTNTEQAQSVTIINIHNHEKATVDTDKQKNSEQPLDLTNFPKKRQLIFSKDNAIRKFMYLRAQKEIKCYNLSAKALDKQQKKNIERGDPINHDIKWSEDMYLSLIELYFENKPIWEIASQLGRTKVSIEDRLMLLKIIEPNPKYFSKNK